VSCDDRGELEPEANCEGSRKSEEEEEVESEREIFEMEERERWERKRCL